MKLPKARSITPSQEIVSEKDARQATVAMYFLFCVLGIGLLIAFVALAQGCL